MSLQNLVGRSLEAVAPDPAAIGRLLAAAGHNLADAQAANRTCFDGATGPQANNHAAFQAAFLRSDIKKWGELVRRTGAHVE